MRQHREGHPRQDSHSLEVHIGQVGPFANMGNDWLENSYPSGPMLRFVCALVAFARKYQASIITINCQPWPASARHEEGRNGHLYPGSTVSILAFFHLSLTLPTA